MNQKYIAPMIAGIFAIITTTLIIFQEEIKSLTSKENIVTDLQGNWEAKWVYEDKSKMPTTSRIKIEEQKDGKLYAIGFGSNDVKNTEYLLEGWNTPTSISISYMSSPDSKKNTNRNTNRGQVLQSCVLNQGNRI